MRSKWTSVVRGVVSGVAVTGLTVGAVAVTAVPAEAAGCRTSFATYAHVKAGSTGSPAGAVQCLLTRAGYRVTVDRSFSSADAQQLQLFQAHLTLPATGQASGRTWSALIAHGSRPTLQTGSRGTDVTRLQLSLRALGHRELPGTTYYGTLTSTAVKSLQRSLGWKPTGVADVRVWRALQAGGSAPASTTPVATVVAASASKTTKGAKALAYAKKQLGEKYKYGAAGPNKWDCSGLTMKAWASAGVKLPHSAAGQSKKGRKVAKSKLKAGDLVFFYSPIRHVGIYAGGGKVIHASRPGKPVAYIKMSYMPFKTARRPG